MKSKLYIGVMSGTSIDSMDAVLVKIENNSWSMINSATREFTPSLREQLLILSRESQSISLKDYIEINTKTGIEFSKCVNQLIERQGIKPDDITAIGLHGQTLFHHTESQYSGSLQIGSPSIVAEKTHITVVADFRNSDIAAGGQGAPLAPAFHSWMFGSNKHKRILINIGGIANISILLNKKSFFGYDIGPGNALLDTWIAKNKQKKYDNKGEWSKSGKANMKLLEILKSDPFFKKTPPKSTGSHDFNLEWILSTKKRFGQKLLAKDIQATLTLLTAELIVDAINKCPKDTDIAFSGGGIKNLSLMALIKDKLNGRHIQSTTDWGIAPEWVEAAGFAFLAHQRMRAKPVELTKTTGSKKKSILGAIYLPPQ